MGPEISPEGAAGYKDDKKKLNACHLKFKPEDSFLV